MGPSCHPVGEAYYKQDRRLGLFLASVEGFEDDLGEPVKSLAYLDFKALTACCMAWKKGAGPDQASLATGIEVRPGIWCAWGTPEGPDSGFGYG